jgi:hypothetical protein
VFDLERALRQALLARPEMESVWAEPLDRWVRQKQQPSELDQLMATLSHQQWVERFAAWQGLIALGGQAVEPLQKMGRVPTHPPCATAYWLLDQIGQETARQLGHRFHTLLCPHCLTYFRPHTIQLWSSWLTYYGCRTCGQSREFRVSLPTDVVVVLDATAKNRQSDQNGRIWANWLETRTLFDFGRVEIIQAGDEEVERFAVQVGNDTDPVRRSRYKKMECVVSPDCRLSANTQRILQHTFGQVVQAPDRGPSARQPATRIETNPQFRNEEIVLTGEAH